MMRRRFVMGFLVVVASVVLAVGCQSGQPGGAAGGKWLAWWEALSVEEKLSHIQPYMVEGAQLSAERPAPHLLSQQEVMIRAAQAMAREGYLDPAHRIYKKYPQLLTVKVAEPILVYHEYLLSQGIVDGTYYVYVVDDKGIALAGIDLAPNEIVLDEDDVIVDNSIFIQGNAKHLITKKEAVATFREAFPHQHVAEPIAVRIWDLEGVKYSNSYIFWYTTVSEAGRSAGEAAAEYLLCASVFSPPPGLNISANPRTALSHGAPAWGTRIARIDEPLHLHEKLAAAKARAVAGEPEPAVGPTEPVKITPVEF